MDWQFLIGPAVGAVIGYITNDIAVRMLFRPRREMRLFGRKVPFTPGLIPKERPRLARAIREVLDHDLLSAEVVEAALLSEKTLAAVSTAAEQALRRAAAEERTPRMLLEGLFGEESFSMFEAKAKTAIVAYLVEQILASDLEKTIATLVIEEAKKRVESSAAALITLFLDDRHIASLEDKLAAMLRDMLEKYAPPVLDGMLETTVRQGLDAPVKSLVSGFEDKIPGARDFLIEQYKALIRGSLPRALAMLDLGGIVEDKLNDLDAEELEALIMRVMKKELRAIVWLGALLGSIMGTVTSLV